MELDHALSLDKTAGEAYLLRGEIYRDLGQFESALVDYEAASQLDGGNLFKIAVGKGICFSGLKRPHEALENFETAYGLKTDDADLLYFRGRALYELEQFGRALRDFTAAYDLGNEYLYIMRCPDLQGGERPEISVHDFYKQYSYRLDEEEARRYWDSHPNAKRLLRDNLFWSTDDCSPIGGDVAASVVSDMWSWRLYNPNSSLRRFLGDMFREWGYNSARIRAVAKADPDLAIGKLHSDANLHDDAVIAAAFVQFMVDGYVDGALRTRASIAADRQSAPSVLEFRTGSDPEALDAIEKTKWALSRMQAVLD